MNGKRARELRAIARHYKKSKKETYRGYLKLSHHDRALFVSTAKSILVAHMMEQPYNEATE